MVLKLTVLKKVLKVIDSHIALHYKIKTVVNMTVVIFRIFYGGMDMKYGYVRVSTPKQDMERQVRNIKKQYPDAYIIRETYTGTKLQGRKEFDKLYQLVCSGNCSGNMIIFDSVSRMSRDADEGFQIYQKLYKKGVSLVFLKEPYINTSVYKKALESSMELTGTPIDLILEGINKYFRELAKEQIYLAFQQAEKEVSDLRQRTREGIETARLNGKQIGQKKGAKLTTKKSIEAKKKIQKYNRAFGGMLTNEETWRLIGITKTTFYKYKKELQDELQA